METCTWKKSPDFVGIPSETHYSLKEMETACPEVRFHCRFYTSETHYSLKEMETTTCILPQGKVTVCVGNPLLSERDGNEFVRKLFKFLYLLLVGNPLLSERDGNRADSKY